MAKCRSPVCWAEGRRCSAPVSRKLFMKQPRRLTKLSREASCTDRQKSYSDVRRKPLEFPDQEARRSHIPSSKFDGTPREVQSSRGNVKISPGKYPHLFTKTTPSRMLHLELGTRLS
ncbi:hypothetical protein Tco_0468778 [Tanacetum coccineum]